MVLTDEQWDKIKNKPGIITESKDCQSCRSSIEDEMVIKCKMERKQIEQETAQKVFEELGKYTYEINQKSLGLGDIPVILVNKEKWQELKSKYGVK